jgi:preprotein translocase subunit SecE
VRNTTEQRAEGGPAGVLKQAVDVVPRFVEFVKEAWQELKKVHWPTGKETYSATLIVVVVVIAVSIFLGLVDFGLSFAMRQILGQS